MALIFLYHMAGLNAHKGEVLHYQSRCSNTDSTMVESEMAIRPSPRLLPEAKDDGGVDTVGGKTLPPCLTGSIKLNTASAFSFQNTEQGVVRLHYWLRSKPLDIS